MKKYCKHCANLIEQERLEIVPDTFFCSSCARVLNPVKPRRGYLSFDQKTGGTLQVLEDSVYESQKHYFKPYGARSTIKNFMRG